MSESKTKLIPVKLVAVSVNEFIKHRAGLICESGPEPAVPESECGHMHEDSDDDFVIGVFDVKDEIGKSGGHHAYMVAVRPNDGMCPCFHVYDTDGEHRKENATAVKGTHACIKIGTNGYFKHGAYQDSLDRETREALDRFLRETRSARNHSIGVGQTNFACAVNVWNDQNHTFGKPNWVDPDKPVQPDYATICD